MNDFSASPARAARVPSSAEAPLAATPPQASGGGVLLVDLNNFASFPTLAIGLIVASLRQAGRRVEVMCPLAYGAPGAAREAREDIRHHLARRVHLSTWAPFRAARDGARRAREWWLDSPDPVILRETRRALERKPDIILLSAYLRHYSSVVEIGRMAAERDVPLLLGGPMFNMPGVAEAWRDIPGLLAIFGGEADLAAARLVETALAGGDLLAFDGVTLPDGRRSPPAPPLRDLDGAPTPDFADFPWGRYPHRIVPLMTGRGCQWNRCVFCSDVISASGRTFRTRSVGSVLREMREQSRRHDTKSFLFLDLKLNSNPAMMRGLSEELQRHVPGAEWIGTVHVDRRRDNGLSRKDLQAAAASGMRRISFGLETGSQRLLDAMAKDSAVETNAEFIRNAHEAGLSVRATMFKGFPGETAEDLDRTADFLERHSPFLDRIRFNEFSVPEGTPIFHTLRSQGEAAEGVRLTGVDHRHARAGYVNRSAEGRAYRRAKARVLRAVHEINRREIRLSARAFDGLM